jgi:hypothetical protein
MYVLERAMARPRVRAHSMYAGGAVFCTCRVRVSARYCVRLRMRARGLCVRARGLCVRARCALRMFCSWLFGLMYATLHVRPRAVFRLT